MSKDLKAFKAPQHVIERELERQRKARAASVLEILHTNAGAVRLFLSVDTQWRSAGMGGLIGLDYVALESAMNMQCIKRKDRPDLFDRIGVIESAVLVEWGKQRKKSSRKS